MDLANHAQMSKLCSGGLPGPKSCYSLCPQSWDYTSFLTQRILRREQDMKHTRGSMWTMVAGMVVSAAVLLGSNSWAATTENTVYSFTGGLDGNNPASQLIFDSAGSAYGTT